MALPPTLPLLEPSAEYWSSVQKHWTDSVGMGAEARQLARMEVLRPFLQEAIRELAIRHHLMADVAGLHTQLYMMLSQRETLPSSPTMLRYHVASLALRMVKEESSVLASRLDDPMAPWHAFRTRVNQLRRSFRAYFFAFLPKHSLAPMLFEKPRRDPSKYWVQLWDSLTDGIPGGGIPSEWAQIRDNYQPTPIPGAFANRGGGLIAPARDWKEVLAKPLLQAAALIESRRPGLMPLYLSREALPDSPAEFAAKLDLELRDFGGVVNDKAFENILQRLTQIQHESSISSLGISPLSLLEFALEEGASKYRVALLQGAILDRQGASGESSMAFFRMLQESNTRKQIGTSLMNLAVNAFAQGKYSEASSLAWEAVEYSPETILIRKNAIGIQEAIWSLEESASENGK